NTIILYHEYSTVARGWESGCTQMSFRHVVLIGHYVKLIAVQWKHPPAHTCILIESNLIEPPIGALADSIVRCTHATGPWHGLLHLAASAPDTSANHQCKS